MILFHQFREGRKKVFVMIMIMDKSLATPNEGCPAINMNLVLSRASTPPKDVGTIVNKTTIPV
jgi:hypothetical protein